MSFYKLLLIGAIVLSCFQSAPAAGPGLPVASAQDSDAFIIQQLQSAIEAHPSLIERPIQVQSRDQIVTLSGLVASEKEARDLLVCARSVPGVRMVRMKVSVVAGAGTAWQGIPKRAKEFLQDGREEVQELRDAADDVLHEATEKVFDAKITAAVKWKLLEDQKKAAADIHVQTNRAIVVLSGKVPNSITAKRALKIASSVDDVIRVHSRLAIINPDTGS